MQHCGYYDLDLISQVEPISFWKVKSMHREDIKAALRKQGSSLTQIALELELERSTIAHVLKGRRSRRVESAIACKLGLPLEKVFPERYPLNPKSEGVA